VAGAPPASDDDERDGGGGGAGAEEGGAAISPLRWRGNVLFIFWCSASAGAVGLWNLWRRRHRGEGGE